MKERKHLKNPQLKQDLYQYEMGIELGADIEKEKDKHLHQMKSHCCTHCNCNHDTMDNHSHCCKDHSHNK